MPNRSVKSKKSLTYSVFILLVLGVFVAGYYYYFIPKNTQALHKNGFLILKTITENVQGKIAGHLNLYRNIFNNARGSNAVTGFLKKNSIDAAFEYAATGNDSPDEQAAGEKNISATNDSLIVNFTIDNSNFIYSIRKRSGNDSGLVFREDLSNFLNPILVTQKSELFTSYALVKVKGNDSKLVYHDNDFAIRSDVRIDSLLPKNVQAYLTGIRDITSPDFNYKMFYYPFEVDSIQLVLCGFVPAEKYNKSVRIVPFSFVSPLAIVFILLLVFLPIIKFAIMDSNEQVRIRDLIMFEVSVFVGASILTLIIIQYLLWKGEEERVRNNLENLSNQINDSFLQEINNEYNQMVLLDSLRSADTTINESVRRRKHIDYSRAVRNYLKSPHYNNSNYYLFDRISWIDTTGMQVIKAEANGEQPVFTNVKDRKYFKALANNEAYELSDSSGKTYRFGWEAIYSWTNGDFNVSISRQTGQYVEALAAKMHSVVEALLPVGYGFCIIDADGKVQLHSDVNRNLRENLFQKAEPSTEIKSSVTARQKASINEVEMYGKWYMMHIRPIKNLPLSLVTFYDRGFIVPVNMRILIFASLFCLFSWLTCLLLWIIIGRSGFRQYPLVYCPMDCLTWLSPQKKEAVYYFHGIAFLLVYILLFLAFIALYNSYYISNYTIFSMVLLTPLNVIGVLFSIRTRCTTKRHKSQLVKSAVNLLHSSGPQSSPANTGSIKRVLADKVIQVALVQLTVSLILYFNSINKYHISPFFLLFQLVVFAWILLYRLAKQPRFLHKLNMAIFAKKGSVVGYYMFAYSSLATLLIITLSVLPSGLYTWYAHNQEILQTVKKQQLHLARDIQQRSSNIYNQKDSLIIPAYYAKELAFNKGIYTIHHDDIRYESDNIFDKYTNTYTKPKDSTRQNRETFENFYFSIAEKVSTPYYDPQSYPALNDYSADSSWRWYVQQKNVNFWYYNPIYIKNTTVAANESLHIRSEMPDRFVFLKLTRITGLVVVIILLVWGLYKWVRINTEQVFLMKYLPAARDVVHKLRRPQKADVTNTSTDWISEYFVVKNVDRHNFLKHLYNQQDYSAYVSSTNEKDLNKFEKDILSHIEAGQGLYDYIWGKCNDKEKYLMYDFAHDGLINYKNTQEIYHLIDKGVFTLDEGDRIRLFSPAFRGYLISKSDSDEIIQIHETRKENSNWQTLKFPLLLLMVSIASLIFFTQQEVFQKLVALAVGVGTLFSQIPKLFDSGSSKPDTKEK
jgi:hypothetical protein